jgi:adenylate kinase family enzyme
MPHIHVTGASGSGTTSLGHALAEALDIRHLDTDHFF